MNTDQIKLPDGWTLVGASETKQDHILVVMAKDESKPTAKDVMHCVWTYNVQTQGCSSGFYKASFREAADHFAAKLKRFS